MIELGAGLGCYTSYLIDAGAQVVASYEGAHNVESITHGLVHQADLSTNLTAVAARTSADWVLCLEVAEHIPRQLEPTFLANLAAFARSGIILSWSESPFGNGHVNFRDPTYVERRLAGLGYVLQVQAAGGNGTRTLPSHVSCRGCTHDHSLWHSTLIVPILRVRSQTRRGSCEAQRRSLRGSARPRLSSALIATMPPARWRC